MINGVVNYKGIEEDKRIVSFDVGSEKLFSIEAQENIKDLINHQGKLAGVSMHQ